MSTEVIESRIGRYAPSGSSGLSVEGNDIPQSHKFIFQSWFVDKASHEVSGTRHNVVNDHFHIYLGRHR